METDSPRRLSFSRFNVLMGTPNPEKNNLLGQTVLIQKPLSIFSSANLLLFVTILNSRVFLLFVTILDSRPILLFVDDGLTKT